MSHPVKSFHFIAKVEDIFFQLQNSDFNGFAVLNVHGRPIGIIERDILITLIERYAWYVPEEYSVMNSKKEVALQKGRKFIENEAISTLNNVDEDDDDT
jgi:hypothetical protein